MLKSFHSDIKDVHPLNSHIDILQTTSSSKPYVQMSRNLIGLVRPNRDLEMLLSFHSDTKDGHALNNLLGIFQTTSSNLYILLNRNLMEASCNMETQNKYNHSIQKSKMAKNLTAKLLIFKQHLFQPIYSFKQHYGGMPQAI